MNAAATPWTFRLRKAAALVAAVLLASLAFGVGLPWLIIDAPPQAETLWAGQVQAPAPAIAFPALSTAARHLGPLAIR